MEIKKYKYIEYKPKEHSKVFKSRADRFKYWEKRYKTSYTDEIFKAGFGLKDCFDYEFINLNKNGTPRKRTTPKPLTQKQRDNFKKAMKKRGDKIKELMKLKKVYEQKLKRYLNSLGYKGVVNIKYFNKSVTDFKGYN